MGEREEKLAHLGRVAQEVFALLAEAQTPLKAYDLLWRLQNKRGAPAPPSTIYRGLNTLVREGMAHKIRSLSAYVACAAPTGAHEPALFICDVCKSVLELNGDAAAKAVAAGARHGGFEPRQVALEFFGLCEACGSIGDKPRSK